MTIRVTATLVCILLFSVAWQRQEFRAQEKTRQPDVDSYSLAVASVLNSATTDFSKVTNIPQRIRLFISAARILPPAQHDDAIRLLEDAVKLLRDSEADNQTDSQRKPAPTALQDEILTAYAALDPERTAALHKEFQALSESPTNELDPKKVDNWFDELGRRRAISNQAAKLALSFMGTDPDKALTLVAQSMGSGTVSVVLVDILQTAMQTKTRELPDRLENVIARALAAKVTLDPTSLVTATVIVQEDSHMSIATRNELLGFLLRSLEAFSNYAKEPGLDSFYISTVFTRYYLNVRPVIAQYLPDQLLAFDLELNQVAPLVPENTLQTLQAFQPEKFSDPRDRLNDIVKDPNPRRRDLRLIGLVSQLLQKGKPENLVQNLDLATDAVSYFSDPDTKSTFSDLLAIARINALVKQKHFIEAQRLVPSISNEPTRAWALIALHDIAAKSDPVVAFELMADAMKTLDKVAGNPYKVELALQAAARLAKADTERSFEILITASRYANASPAKIDPPTKPAVAFGLEATIGENRTRLGIAPESLAEVRIDPALSALAATDWFRAKGVLEGIREPILRSRLQLEFARAVIAAGPKAVHKEEVAKPSSKI